MSTSNAVNNAPCVDPQLLRRALRLVHCLQKERGASCAYYASRNEQNIVDNMNRARSDSDRAIQMMLPGKGEFKVHATLMKIRKMVQLDLALEPQQKKASSHRILVCFNALISSVVHDYFMEKIAQQEKNMQMLRTGSDRNNPKEKCKSPQFHSRKNSAKKGHSRAKSLGDALLLSQLSVSQPPPRPPSKRLPPPLTPFGSAPDNVDLNNVPFKEPPLTLGVEPPLTLGPAPEADNDCIRRRRSGSENSPQKVHFDEHNPDQAEEVLVRLLNILACFVKLKESTGVERAVLCCLVVSGEEDSLLMSDLVLEVENQRRLLDELKGLPFGSLRNLVEELVEMSIPLRELQQKILANFDLEGVIIKDEQDVTVVWDLITVYIDKLHSLELLIIEEIEYCLPSIEYSNSHNKMHAKQALLESEFIVGLFGAAASEVEVKNRLSSMSAEEVKQKLLEGFGATKDCAICKKETPGSNGAHHIKDNNTHNGDGSVADDGILLTMPNLPASKEWEISLYELKFLKRIGEGAAGTTYLAKWTGLEVAVKVASISENGLESWRTEVQALQKLHHPNIIRLLGSVYHQNPLTFCLVLEYCNAGDLDTALTKSPTAPNFFFHVAISIAKGVAYLHSRGVMHRDIKPENILIDGNVKSGNFQVKVTDFGVATDTSMLGDRTAETGTYRWMAPEVLRHESYSNMADVYSFAVVLWQLVTREVPYMTFSQIEAAGKVALECARPPFPSGAPKAVCEIIETCWRENPDERWAFEEVCQKLAETEVGLNLADRKWLDAPLGHPVYYPREEKSTTEQAELPTRKLDYLRKSGKDEKKKSGFFKLKMFGH